MGNLTRASDWECQGVAQAGGAYILGAGVYMFEFRSQKADFRGKYLFLGAGVGYGGSMGGGSGPSPIDIASGNAPSMWSSIKAEKDFSGDDLDMAYAALSTLAAAGAYGYALTGISAGLIDSLFDSQEVSGWGTGVGVVGAILVGMWKQIGATGYY